MTVKISKASKMPCPSWSLPAWFTCPGARQPDGSPTEACSKCYALQGRYLFRNVREAREHNRSDWQRSGWVSDMVEIIKGEKFFRWFDSGDIYSVKLAQKILAVCVNTPDTQHWIPTRSYKIPKMEKVLGALACLDNVVVRWSADNIDDHKAFGREAEHSSVIVSNTPRKLRKGSVLCEAYSRGGKCGSCRSCWSKSVDTILYPIHGGSASTKAMRRK